jgi:hypothetical protein
MAHGHGIHDRSLWRLQALVAERAERGLSRVSSFGLANPQLLAAQGLSWPVSFISIQWPSGS